MAKTSNNTQMFLILAVVAGFVALAYWWFFQPSVTTTGEATVPMEERAAPVEDQSDLDAARSELDSTNLGQVDVELQDLGTQVSY